MAQFTVTINAYDNQVPNQVGDLTIPVTHDTTYTFTVADFTTLTNPPYNDPEGDALLKIQIVDSLPTTGELQLNGVPVNINDEVTAIDIGNSLLTFVADPGTNIAYTDTFSFIVADAGSGQYFISELGTITLNVAAAVNEAPSVVGDGNQTIDYGQTLIFTRAMFTTATTPPYADPEGDAALNLRIDTLPVLGKIKLNGVDVVANQIVSFANIDSGLLTYVPDLADTDGDIQGFTFSIADAGSGIFTS